MFICSMFDDFSSFLENGVICNRLAPKVNHHVARKNLEVIPLFFLREREIYKGGAS